MSEQQDSKNEDESRKPGELPDPFARAIEHVLEHLNSASWIGMHSPLALPYIVSSYSARDAGPDSTEHRGASLIALFKQALLKLQPEHQRVLVKAYFERDWALNSYGVSQVLGVSESTYFRQRSQAIKHLADAVHSLLRPALRREHVVARSVFGRDEPIATCVRHLNIGQSVAITGPSGIGKTSVALSVAQSWRRAFDRDGPPAVFWYTLRSGLNDTLGSLVFALADFLRERGITGLWGQLIADRGLLQRDYLLGLLRYDLHAVSKGARPVLFCIDEVEVLDSERENHRALISVFDEMKSIVPLLMVGQRLVAEPRHHLPLSGLEHEAIAHWLKEEHISAPGSYVDELARVTDGNPAMIWLAVTLIRLNEPLSQLPRRISSSPTVQLLLDRVWQRLLPDERTALIMLSVFRVGVSRSADEWRDRQPSIDRLLGHRLLESDGHDMLFVPSHVAAFISGKAPEALLAASHSVAATLLASLGQFTEAAYHLLKVDGADVAISLWWRYRHTELERGMAQVAHRLFADINASELPSDEFRRVLSLIRAYLAEMLGLNSEIVSELDQDWANSPWAHGTVARLVALAQERLGQFDRSEASFKQGIQAVLESLPMQLVQLHLGLGHLHTERTAEVDQAMDEALQASVWAERFLGIVCERKGDFQAARASYERALANCEQLSNGKLALRARILVDFGILDWKQGFSESSVSHLLQAERIFREQGDTVRLSYNHINLSAAYIVAGMPEEALRVAETGLALVQHMKNDHLTANLASNAGEACFALGRLEDAERYAMQCIRLEEVAHSVSALITLAHIYRARGQSGQSESTFKLAIRTAQGNRDPFVEAPAWRGLSQLYRSIGAQDSADEAAAQARRIYAQLNLPDDVSGL